jgi:hypothetical protein
VRIRIIGVVKLSLQMVIFTMESKRIKKGKDLVHFTFLTKQNTGDSSCRIKSTAMGFTSGETEKYIMDNGKIIKEMVTDIRYF